MEPLRSPRSLGGALGEHAGSSTDPEHRRILLERLVENSSDINFLLSREGGLEYLSPAFERVLGHASREWLGRSVFDLVHPEDLDRARSRFLTALRAPGIPVPWLVRARHVDGTYRWLEGSGTDFSADPDVRGVIANCHDVTELERAQAELRLLSRAVEQSPSSIVITDANGEIEYVNPTFCAITGYSEEEVLGRNPRLLQSGDTSPETYAELWRRLRNGQVWRGTFANRKKNGEKHWEKASISPITDERGAITHYVAVKHDVTDRIRAESALRASEERFQKAFDNAHIGMAIVALGGRWTRVNNALCRLVGYEADELLGMTFHQLTHPDDVPASVREVRRLCAGEIAGYRLECRYRHKLGDEVTVELNVSLAHDEQGRPLYFVAQIQDITARKAMERTLVQWAHELKEANRALVEERERRARVETELRLAQKLEAMGQLAAGIAHEINTPIQFVGDSAKYLERAFGDVVRALEAHEAVRLAAAEALGAHPALEGVARARVEGDLDFASEEIPRAFARVFDGIARVTAIVRAMKELAHPASREAAPADLNRMLQNTAIVARHEYKHVADLELDLGDLPPVVCNASEVNQVLLNLVVNAAHAIGDVVAGAETKGKITLRTRVEEGAAVVEIADTGGGIPDAIRDRVFEPFYTTKPPGKGTGQGLAIARSIVDRHGGSLAFTANPGGGTRFTMRLPIAGADGKKEPVR